MAKKQQNLIAHITDIRARNNLLWMELLRLALESSPRKAKIILSEININDKAISRSLAKL
jgi:hypothetical protein